METRGSKFHQKRKKRSSFGNSVGTAKMIEIMAENNEDARVILITLSSLCLNSERNDPTICRELMLQLDDMNIRGAQLATAYTFCHSNILCLVNSIRSRDKEMVQFINAHLKDRVDGFRFELAVQRGGSWR